MSDTSAVEVKKEEAPVGNAARKSAKRPSKPKVSKPKATKTKTTKGKTMKTKVNKTKTTKAHKNAAMLRVLPNGTEVEVKYNGMTTASGAKSYGRDDAVAKKLVGLDVGAMCKVVAGVIKAHIANYPTYEGKTAEQIAKALLAEYGKKGNLGLQRMWLGNIMRGATA